jgi:CRISPR system Cascade subunit CasA
MVESTPKFNLIDERWIPTRGYGLASLKDVFSSSLCLGLAGNAWQKIALFKLLLAIGQSAYSPANDQEWETLTDDHFGQKCIQYLEQHRDRFWLYGDNPFLQLPVVIGAAAQPLGAIMPDIATGNTSVLQDMQRFVDQTDAQKALLLVCLSGGALGGKKADNSFLLDVNYRGKQNDKGKASTGKPSPWISSGGYLHSFFVGDTVLSTVKLNLWTKQDIQKFVQFSNGFGTPPWEHMPSTENCEVAQTQKASLMGRLVPLCRFMLLDGQTLHYTEGISYLDHKDGMVDPTCAYRKAGKDFKMKWANAEKRPWREITSLLSFVSSTSTDDFTCQQLAITYPRAVRQAKPFSVWSGGIQVSYNAGEQYLSGSDDVVESTTLLPSPQDLNETWFIAFKYEVAELEKVLAQLRIKVSAYYKELTNQTSSAKAELAKAKVGKAEHAFWELIEPHFQALVDSADNLTDMAALRRKIASIATTVYDQSCPSDSARQIESWAKHKPNYYNYVSRQEAKK